MNLRTSSDPAAEALFWAADELDIIAREALIEYGCTDDNLKNCERAAHNARNAAVRSERDYFSLRQRLLRLHNVSRHFSQRRRRP